MKILMVYYSRTGATRKIAEVLASKLIVTVEEIKDTIDRSGTVGFMRCAHDGSFGRTTKLQPTIHHPANFDLVIIGSPIWSLNLSAPIRTYLEQYKADFKKVAFFCAMGGTGNRRALQDLERILGQKIVAEQAITTKQAFSLDLPGRMNDFANKIKQLN